jgi:UDP:flavonoid glycosyltransferase YjiC (YdhE family)
VKILICTVGSRGDVQPLVVLARTLKRRGHSVAFGAPPNFRGAVERAELDVLPVGADTGQLLEENQQLALKPPTKALPGQFALMRRELTRQLSDLDAVEGPLDLVVAAGLCNAGSTVAQRCGAGYCYLAQTLVALPSAHHPPGALPFFGLPGLGNRALWRAVTALFDRALEASFSEGRSRRGLDPTVRPWESIRRVQTLLAQDAVLAALPADVKAVQVPALVEDDLPVAALPDDVARFLEAPGDAVFVGFGSMPVDDRATLVTLLRDVQRMLGQRLLVQVGEPEPLPDGMLAIREVDHRALFPHVAAVVHHGGAGTTATALRAGAVQVIVPHILDQFFHGRRVAELGVGPVPVPRTKLTAAALTQALREVPRLRPRAREVAARLGPTGGAEAAAMQLEQLAARGPSA